MWMDASYVAGVLGPGETAPKAWSLHHSRGKQTPEANHHIVEQMNKSRGTVLRMPCGIEEQVFLFLNREVRESGVPLASEI